MGKYEMELKFYLETLWERFSSLVSDDQTEEVINEENSIIEELDKMMPFKNQLEHEHWLDALQGFKCWEDFEELTLRIIRRLK